MKIIIITLLLTLSACSITPYKISLKQGSAMTQKNYHILKLGMTKEKVISLLGSPNINSVYHPNRFDYVYMYQQEQQYFSSSYYLIFTDNLLAFISDQQKKQLNINQYN